MRTTVAIIIAAVAVACGFTNDPLPTTPTADNPCGATYVPCLDMAGNLSGMCCWEHTTCGGGKYSVGCNAGECCYIGSGGGVSASAPRPQFRAPR